MPRSLDDVEWLIGIGGVALLVWYFAIRKPRQVLATDAAQTHVERRVLHLMQELPHLDDDELALLVHDELVTGRVRDAEYYRWATAQTVGRIRRLVLLEAGREAIRQRGLAAAPTVETEPSTEPTSKQPRRRKERGVEVVRLKSCPHCEREIRGDASRCVHCLERVD